jgi:hypothetical protein
MLIAARVQVQMPKVLAKLKEIGNYIFNGPANPWKPQL